MGNVVPGRRYSIFTKKGSDNQSPKQSTQTAPETASIGPPPLTSEHVEILTRTWSLLENDLANVGLVTFISLFQAHPEVKEAFAPFSGVDPDDLKDSQQLRAHALRVMTFVQKAITRLQEPESLNQLIVDLGRRHLTYKAKAKYVELVGPQFLIAIQPFLEKEWTDGVSEAWNLLFAHISHTMRGTMLEEAKEDTVKVKA